MLLAYDGAGFAGWAKQPGKRTVEQELESALGQLRQQPVTLTVAGRTDAGVHARGQVASHPGAPASAGALNGLLPADLRVLGSEPAADGFDARRDALARTYRYRLHAHRVADPFERGRALHWHRPLDRAALRACAAALPGEHDFTAFTPSETYHQRFKRRIERAEWVEEGEHLLAFWIEADSFMRHMVRTLVGSMLAVASGRFEPAWFEGLIEGRPRAEADNTAPAHGLYLESVRY